MKTLNVIGWASAGAAVLLIFLGLISILINKSILSVNHVVNYFHVANSFLLITVAAFIVVNRCECKK